MKDKDILNVLGLNNRTITLTADDEYLQLMLEKKIRQYIDKQLAEDHMVEQLTLEKLYPFTGSKY